MGLCLSGNREMMMMMMRDDDSYAVAWVADREEPEGLT